MVQVTFIEFNPRIDMDGWILCPCLESNIKNVKYPSEFEKYLAYMSKKDCIGEHCRFFNDCWKDTDEIVMGVNKNAD